MLFKCSNIIDLIQNRLNIERYRIHNYIYFMLLKIDLKKEADRLIKDKNIYDLLNQIISTLVELEETLPSLRNLSKPYISYDRHDNFTSIVLHPNYYDTRVVITAVIDSLDKTKSVKVKETLNDANIVSSKSYVLEYDTQKDSYASRIVRGCINSYLKHIIEKLEV